MLPFSHDQICGLLLTSSAISAIVLAIQMIIIHCKKLKYKRRIVLVTDGKGPMNTDSLSEITKKIKEDNIELIILFVADAPPASVMRANLLIGALTSMIRTTG